MSATSPAADMPARKLLARIAAIAPAAVVLLVVILHVLRPADTGFPFITQEPAGRVYAFTEAAPIALSGRDADRIEAEFIQTYANAGIVAQLRFRSADERCYTLGPDAYTNGKATRNGPTFVIEKRTGLRWQQVADGSSAISRVGSSESYVWSAFSADEPVVDYFTLYTDRPGRYRLTLTFAEYIPSSANSAYLHYGGSSGDGRYTASFEYIVPQPKDEVTPRVANFTMIDHTDDNIWYRRFNTTVAEANLFVTGLPAGSILQTDRCTLTRLSSSGEYLPETSASVTFADAINSGDDSPCVRPVGMNIYRWEYDAQYRLTLIFTADDAEYTLPIDLNFFLSNAVISATGLELDGDSGYFAEACAGPVVSGDDFLCVTLRPREPCYLLLGSYNEIFYNGRRAMGIGEDIGYIEKRTADGWEFLRDLSRYGAETVEGGDDVYFSLSWNGVSKYRQRMIFYAPFLDTPGDYRFTINFREVDPETRLAMEEVHSVRFTYTVPENAGLPVEN